MPDRIFPKSYSNERFSLEGLSVGNIQQLKESLELVVNSLGRYFRKHGIIITIDTSRFPVVAVSEPQKLDESSRSDDYVFKSDDELSLRYTDLDIIVSNFFAIDCSLLSNHGGVAKYLTAWFERLDNLASRRLTGEPRLFANGIYTSSMYIIFNDVKIQIIGQLAAVLESGVMAVSDSDGFQMIPGKSEISGTETSVTTGTAGSTANSTVSRGATENSTQKPPSTQALSNWKNDLSTVYFTLVKKPCDWIVAHPIPSGAVFCILASAAVYKYRGGSFSELAQQPCKLLSSLWASGGEKTTPGTQAQGSLLSEGAGVKPKPSSIGRNIGVPSSSRSHIHQGVGHSRAVNARPIPIALDNGIKPQGPRL